MLVFRIAIACTSMFCGSLLAEGLPQTSSATQSETSPVSALQSSSLGLPRYSELRGEVRSLLRKHALSETLTEEIANTLPMITTANRLAADPRFTTSPALQALRGRLLARLRSIKKETVADMRRQKKKPTTIEIDRTVLAQLNQAANPNAVNNAVAADYGSQLIELIQRTISPQSWDVNGGASTIQYWRPGMALVVRAPQGIHRELNPLLLQLRQQ